MRKWFCALALGALILVPAIASAQAPRPTYLATTPINWRVSDGSGGYADSLAKDLSWNASSTTATNVDTTEAIPTRDFAYLTDGSASASGALGPVFYFTTPNTSTSDSLDVTVQGSIDGSTWQTISNAQYATSGLAATTAPVIRAMPILYANLSAAATWSDLTLPWPLIRLIVRNTSKSQSFSAAKVTMRYMSVLDGQSNGNGSGYSAWRLKTGIYWENGPADSLVKNVAADNPDTTGAISLADVDWGITASPALAQQFGRLFIYTDKTTSGNDSLYVNVQSSMDGVNWSASGGGYTAASSILIGTGGDSKIIAVPLSGALITTTPGSNLGSIWGAPFVRFIIKLDEDGVIPQARLAFMYPSRTLP